MEYLTMAQLKCSRCKKTKLVSGDYTFKICPDCREYQFKKRHELTDEALEKLVIKSISDVEEKFKQHKHLFKKMGAKPLNKEKFIADYFESQKIQIANYKKFLERYKTETLKLHSLDCLKFRGMLHDKGKNPNWQPKNDALLNLFINHTISCNDCATWYKLKNNQDLVSIPFCEGGVSQKDFDSALDDFYSVFQKPKDGIDAFLDGLRNETCMSCGNNKVTVPENGRVVCPYCEPRGIQQ
jgi:hypothetical protein